MTSFAAAGRDALGLSPSAAASHDGLGETPSAAASHDGLGKTPFAAASQQLLGEGDGVSEGRMLHNPGLRSGNGKYFGFERKGDLVVKLPEARVRALIACGDGSVMDRGQPDRPLREWVCLRPPDAAACLAYLREARAFVDPDAAS